MSPLHLLLVALGGAIGATGRHLLGIAVMRLVGPGFPWGTFAANVIGSFVMGAFIELWALKFGGAQPIRLFVAVGMLGGFTTFSSFSLDAVTLYERGAMLPAAGYVLGSVVASLAALFAGLAIVRALA
ncbi:camphor resistance protein CrcB [Hartmannibacter diazotrophicus]|uniref:Fluoride-specific ion channel FluC n=1 Tax=Hartmannibacter diazotrophicus TaxID=1482074 RepID=A0A2C9D5N5_9HYPH|nr:fluoride efflux transporter CrcB [Hartmannibacter diazotrophicus]SON55469.1 camphor resistance protein CrcB [Hartmannibacter diazotrophicus]